MSSVLELSAATAYERYRQFLEEGRLVQGSWHDERDGRQLACALGSLDPSIEGSVDCPATVMPRWLAKMTPWFFDRQTFEDAKAWGLDFYAELKRLNGQVPFSVIHDWHATVVTPLAIEVSEKRGKDVAPHKLLQEMHGKAAAGEKFDVATWKAALLPAFQQRDAYADAYAYADADAYAYAYADADAYAYAYADADAYADAYAYAYAYAYAERQRRMKALAAGMVECLRRVPDPA